MLITILLACSVSTQFQSSHNTVESFWRCLPLWFIYLSLHVCLGVCTHLLWVIVQHWMCLDAATFMGHACHRTQMHLIGTPGRFFRSAGTSPKTTAKNVSQVLTPSQEHHTEDGSSISQSSSFTILLIRACQDQFQMICVVSGMLPILKAPFSLSVESWNLWFCII